MNVLGLNWNPEDDILSLEVKLLTDRFVSIKNTKRGVLSVAAMMFDPIGAAAPFIVIKKHSLQENWDQELPDDLKERWLA